MKKISTLVFLLVFGLAYSSCAAGLNIDRITCDYRQDPMLVSTLQPVFGWQLSSESNGAAQSAYQVVVEAVGKGMCSAKGECWNSGKVISGQSQQIAYAGKPLQPDQTYRWSVRVWDERGKKVRTKSSGVFHTAPSTSQLKEASWIGAIRKADSHLPEGRTDWHGPSFKKKKVRDAWNAIDTLALRSIYLRKEFQVGKRLVSARATISGLGHYELTVNGKRIGNSEFDPLWSDYDKTVYYSAYSLLDVLNPGDNAIGVCLGNGFYNLVGNRYNKLWVSFGPPTLHFRLVLQYADGSTETVVSDGSWKFHPSPITYNNLFNGENYDARLELPGWDTPGYDANDWKQVVLQEEPAGVLQPQTADPVRTMKTYGVKTHKQVSEGVQVFDMGQNLSGAPTLRIRGPKGAVVRIWPGERLDEKGNVTQRNTGGPCYYEYILKGEGEETWTPKFSYYGYQYLQVDSADWKHPSAGSNRPVILDVTSRFIYNSAPELGSFSCSNDIYTRTHTLIQNAVKSNFNGVFTDCPHREKLGWIEQNHLCGPALLYNYDLTSFMPKMVQDMMDAQNPNGLVPNIAPEYLVFGGAFSDSPEWGMASLIVPWSYYEFYGDDRLIRMAYPMMKRYVDYLGTKANGHLLNHGLGDWYDYGPKRAGMPQNSPITVSATAHYFQAADMLVRSARHLGKTADAESYRKLKEAIGAAYNQAFYHPETHLYANGSQYCQAVSLYMGLVPPGERAAVLKNLVDSLAANNNRLTTGDIGNRYLFRTLTDNGLNERMHLLNNHYDVPGYGFQLQFGLTTMTEQWDPRYGNSWNHFMMGQIDEWFFRTLAGIRPDPERPGFQHFIIAPEPVEDMTWVKATHRTLYGEIVVDWEKKDGTFVMNVHVPANCSARIIFPECGKNWTLNGIKVSDNEKVTILRAGKHQLKSNHIH